MSILYGILIAVMIIGAILAVIGLFLLGIWFLYVGISDTIHGKFSFWALVYMIVGFWMVFGSWKGGKSRRLRERNFVERS
jgi:hypothetical protein